MTELPPDETTAAALANLGPFFALQPSTGAWQPLRALLDPATLAPRVAHVRAAQSARSGADVEPRVAASTLSLGLFARLMSPVLGAAALRLGLPRPSLDDTWWQPADRGPWPLALTGPAVQPDPAAALTDVVSPLVAQFAQQWSLSSRVLWGNAAAAVFGAAAVIRTRRPDLARTASGIATRLLAGPLAGTGNLRAHPDILKTPDTPDDARIRRFVRSSCCLYYRVPGGGYCGDCVLTNLRQPA